MTPKGLSPIRILRISLLVSSPSKNRYDTNHPIMTSISGDDESEISRMKIQEKLLSRRRTQAKLYY